MSIKKSSDQQVLVPDLPSMANAMNQAKPISDLLLRVKTSQHYLDAISHDIPDLLRRHVKAGPLDEEGWTLLVSNTAISSKLRQLQPQFLHTLSQRGYVIKSLKLKVLF